jgi:hypothetical protein
MHKNIGAAIIRQDEAKPAICVEKLHSASWHFLVAFHPPPPGHAVAPPSSVMEIAAPHGRPFSGFGPHITTPLRTNAAVHPQQR